MSFNVWLAVSVSLGSGIGYFMFAWILPVNPDFGDHCQWQKLPLLYDYKYNKDKYSDDENDSIFEDNSTHNFYHYEEDSLVIHSHFGVKFCNSTTK